ncbi:SET domain-containing protein [Aureococcus anophagefferens]|nr:SET domain-containing protein [Aureococcus anophagefferens]
MRLPIKREWFEAICYGEKRVEFREASQYWRSRLLGKAALDVRLENGVGDAAPPSRSCGGRYAAGPRPRPGRRRGPRRAVARDDVARAVARAPRDAAASRPSKFTKIRMHAAPSAKRAAKAARGSGSRDGAAVCECITAVEWDARVDAILCGRAAPRTGKGSSTRGPMGAPPKLSRAPLVRAPGESDDDARSRFRREKCIGVECDGDCLNRNMEIECDPATCPMGDKCQNRCFAAKLGSKVSVEKAGRCGRGLFAREPIPEGAFVVEALGELISEEEAQERSRRARQRRRALLHARGVGRGDQGARHRRDAQGQRVPLGEPQLRPELPPREVALREPGPLRHLRPAVHQAGRGAAYDYRWASFERCYCGAANCVGVMDGVKKNPVGAAAR